MNKLIWKPVYYEKEVECLGRTSLSYLLQGAELSFLFIHEVYDTSVMIMSLDEDGLIIYHVLEIESYKFISKITGNNNFILMLDVTGQLFYLKGIVENYELAFNFTNVYKFLSRDVYLTWQKLGRMTNCLALQAGLTGVSCLHHDGACIYSSFYNSTDIRKGLAKFTSRRLSYFDSNRMYFMTNITGENAKLINDRILKVPSSIDEVILIIESTQLRFSKPAVYARISTKLFPIDFGTDSVISVLSFNKKACIFIICNSGKIICLKLKSLQSKQFFLNKKVHAVTAYEDVEIKLLWSDRNYLYLSTLSDNGEILDLDATCKIGGVTDLVISTCNIIMAITRNACVYETRPQFIKNKLAVMPTLRRLLKRMRVTADNLENMIEKIKENEYFIKALEISKLPIKSNNICVNANNDCIKLINNTDFTFEKELWKIQFETDDFPKRKLEIIELSDSILPGDDFDCSFNGKNYRNLRVTLFCDAFLPQTIISVKVQVLSDNIKSYKDGNLAYYNQYLIDSFKFQA